MPESLPARRRLDIPTLELILVIGLLTLHEFLLSDAMSLPLALRRSNLAELSSLDRIVSGLEFLVPIVIFAAMVILWLTRRNALVRHVAIVFLVWVTLRLTTKIALVLITILSRPQSGVGVLLKDTAVLWIVNILLFGVWYWIIDGGGPDARRDNTLRRFDFSFPQRSATLAGWESWRPRFWDYLFLGFCGSTQFGLGDTQVLSIRAKFLLMLQATLSIAVIVFIASIAISVIH